MTGILGRGDEDTDLQQREHHVRTQEKAAICEPRREAAGRTHPADTLRADFKPPER